MLTIAVLIWYMRFWRAHNAHLLKSAEQEAQLASLRAAYAADSATLEQLERTNVYNDAFCIGHDGVFGTINGLRLGRVPSVPVRSLIPPIPNSTDLGDRWNGPKSTLRGVKRCFFCTPLLGNWTIRLKGKPDSDYADV